MFFFFAGIKKQSVFRNPKPQIFDGGESVTFTFNQQDLSCSDKIIKPVHKIVTEVVCSGKVYKSMCNINYSS